MSAVDCSLTTAFGGGADKMCSTRLIRDMVQAAGACLALIRIVLLLVSKERVDTSKPLQNTNGELIDFLKLSMSLFLAAVPVIDALDHGEVDWQHLYGIGSGIGSTPLDNLIRTVTWLMSFGVAYMQQSRGARESWLMRGWWLGAALAGLADVTTSLINGFGHGGAGVLWLDFARGLAFFVLLVGAVMGNRLYYSKGDERGSAYARGLARVHMDRLSSTDGGGGAAYEQDGRSGGFPHYESTVGDTLWKNAKYGHEEDEYEFRSLRYTPIDTTDPRRFVMDTTELRCAVHMTGQDAHRMKLLFLVSLSNESPQAFKKTMRGICENLTQLVRKEGAEVYKRVACVVLADGEMDPLTLAQAEVWGLYDRSMIQPKLSKGADNGEDSAAVEGFEGCAMHMFEYTAQLTEDDNFVKFFPPLQVIFAHKQRGTQLRAGDKVRARPENGTYNKADLGKDGLVPARIKQDNKDGTFDVAFDYGGDHAEQRRPKMAIKKVERTGKLDTQRWFFEAFAHQLDPEFCFCTYAGVELGPRAVYKLYTAASIHKDYGAVCCEVRTNRYSVRQDWVESAQGFQYKLSHMFDRSFETMFGFVLRMPEHATLYRWDAIKEDPKTQHSPLREYFRAAEEPVKDGNDLLLVHRHAPQRVLQFQMLARPGAKWTTAYIKNAVAVVQVPSDMNLLVDRMGRWLNAAHLGVLYNIRNFGQLWTHSAHPVGRKIALFLMHMYTVIEAIIAWFTPAIFFALFIVAVRSLKAPCVSYLGDTTWGCWSSPDHQHVGTLFGFFNNTGRAAFESPSQNAKVTYYDYEPIQHFDPDANGNPHGRSPLGVWTCVKSPGDSNQAPMCYPIPMCQAPFPGSPLVDCCTGDCRRRYQFAESTTYRLNLNATWPDPGMGTLEDMIDAEHRRWYFRFALGDHSIQDCLDDEHKRSDVWARPPTAYTDVCTDKNPNKESCTASQRWMPNANPILSGTPGTTFQAYPAVDTLNIPGTTPDDTYYVGGILYDQTVNPEPLRDRREDPTVPYAQDMAKLQTSKKCTPWMLKDTVLNTLYTGHQTPSCFDNNEVSNDPSKPNPRQYPFKDKYNVIHQNPTCCAPALPNLTESITSASMLEMLTMPEGTAKVESWIQYANYQMSQNKSVIRQMEMKCGNGTVFSAVKNTANGTRMEYACHATGCGTALDGSKILALIFNTILALLLLSTFTFSIGNKATDILYESKLISTFLGLMVMLMLYAYIYFVSYDLAKEDYLTSELPISNSLFRWGTCGLFAIPFLTAFAHGELAAVFTGSIQYLFFLPTKLLTCQIYALANMNHFKPGTVRRAVDEVSHRPRQQNNSFMDVMQDEQDDGESNKPLLKAADIMNRFNVRKDVFRSYAVLTWVVANAAMVYGLSELGDEKRTVFGLIFILLWFVWGIKVVGSLAFCVYHYLEHTKLCGFFGKTNAERVRMMRDAEQVAATQQLLTNVEIEQRRRKAGFSRAVKFFADVKRDAEVFGPSHENDAMQAAIEHAEGMLKSVKHNEEMREDSLEPAANAEGKPNTVKAFDDAVEKAIQGINELQNLAMERRKLLNLRRAMPTIVSVRHLDANPKLKAAHQSAYDAIALANNYPWKRMGQLNDVRERVRKASGFVEQLRQMERVRRETILHKYLEQFNSIAETAGVAAADEDGHLFRAARRRLRKAQDHLESVQNTWESTQGKLRAEIEELEELRGQVVTKQRDRQRRYYKVVADLTKRLRGPATHPNRVHDNELAIAVEQADERLIELQQAIGDPSKAAMLSSIKNRAVEAVEEARAFVPSRLGPGGEGGGGAGGLMGRFRRGSSRHEVDDSDEDHHDA